MSFAVAYSGRHDALEKAVTNHQTCVWGGLSCGHWIGLLSVVAVLLAGHIGGIYGALAVAIVAVTTWAHFFGARQAVRALRKLARLNDAAQALTALLSRALSIAYYSNLTRIASSISAATAAALLAFERFLAALGGHLAHISLAPRLLPVPSAHA